MDIKNKRGQNTVEYMLMLTVVVGVALVAGMGMKKYMPGLISTIQTKITDAANGLGN